MPLKPATDILTALRVRPGFQLTTYTVRRYPLVCVDFFYDRPTERFALRVNWTLQTKTVYLQSADVESGTAAQWSADKTFRLTASAIARLAAGLDSLLAKILSRPDVSAAKSA